jgi:hypothetical protein
MRRLSFAVLVLVLGGSPSAVCAEEPRAVIERALKAMGGAEVVKQQVAVRMKVKGKIGSEALGQTLVMEGEVWEFNKQTRMSFQSDFLGNKIEATVVLNGDKSWMSAGGQVKEFGKDEIESQRILKHVDRVTDLAPVLTDKGLTLASLPAIKVEGRPAAGIKVSCKDLPDTSLYFDKETGLLVKYAYRAKLNSDQKESLHETLLSDYRVPDLAAADEKILREAKRETTSPALLSFLRAQTPAAESLAKVKALIRKLGDDAFKVRERASAELVSMGPIALPLLREAAKDDDREVARRARECLQKIGEDSSKSQVSAAIRLLGLRKPEGAAEVLLNYLPSADAEAAQEVRAALFAVAQRNGKPDPVLLRVLEDKDPLRRQAAAAALGKDGGAYARRPGRRLFGPVPKIAMKHKGFIDGKLETEIETLDYQLFNAFEDKVFAKP